MFIFNVKVSRTKIFKWILSFMAIICVALAGVGIFKMYSSNQDVVFSDGNCMPSDGIANLTDENYTNILQEVHKNLDTYIGQKICYTGYVYRVPDLEENQFVLARDMELSNTNQTVVVGFLCNCQNAKQFENYTWIKVTGTIQKGYYLGDIPCVEIEEIEKVEPPENKTVPAPNDNFIETAVIY